MQASQHSHVQIECQIVDQIFIIQKITIGLAKNVNAWISMQAYYYTLNLGMDSM